MVWTHATELPDAGGEVLVNAMTTYDEYRNTPLWKAVTTIVADLDASGEITIQTAPDYVIGFMCRELAVKWVVASSALTPER